MNDIELFFFMANLLNKGLERGNDKIGNWISRKCPRIN
jgi:hypothetical protein